MKRLWRRFKCAALNDHRDQLISVAERKGGPQVRTWRCLDCKRHRTERREDEGKRSHVYVHADYNPDEVRTFYEVPRALATRIQADGERRTFVECLADLLPR